MSSPIINLSSNWRQCASHSSRRNCGSSPPVMTWRRSSASASVQPSARCSSRQKCAASRFWYAEMKPASIVSFRKTCARTQMWQHVANKTRWAQIQTPQNVYAVGSTHDEVCLHTDRSSCNLRLTRVQNDRATLLAEQGRATVIPARQSAAAASRRSHSSARAGVALGSSTRELISAKCGATRDWSSPEGEGRQDLNGST